MIAKKLIIKQLFTHFSGFALYFVVYYFFEI